MTSEEKLIQGAGEALAKYYSKNASQIAHPKYCSFCQSTISRRVKSPKGRAIINLPCGHVEGSRPKEVNFKGDIF